MDVQEAGLGQIQEHLLISLIISWIVVFFGVFKGLGSIGWAVSITATLPYFLLWRKAAEQVFYSLGIDAGPLISMASFSRYRNNIYRDAVLMVIMQVIYVYH
uniref:ABC transmembrane type-1 domain-containing protein n=1 Tax=Globodera pallida TaxID=36090 RepID=A0A183BYU8_GLOPA